MANVHQFNENFMLQPYRKAADVLVMKHFMHTIV